MDQGDVTLLTSPAGRALLAELSARPDADLADPLPVLTRLRAQGHPADLAAAALTQARLRVRARAKLGERAERLLLTPAGYEQATRAEVAAHRAARIAASGARTVADLGCGIGGDTLALAEAGLDVVAVERDAVTAAVARANVEALGYRDRVVVHETDAATALAGGLLDHVDAAFVDPARRTGRGRVFDPEAYSPPFSFVAELARRVPATVAKVAPGIPHDLVAPGVEAEWVSDRGGVKEAALWHGPLATPGVRRRATLLPSGATLTDTEPEVTTVREVGRWLHEPDGAVVRAGLVGQVAARLDGGLVDPTIAYVTTDSEARDVAAQRFEVLASLPFGLKPIRAELRRLGAGEVVVKKRGSAIDPDEFRQRLGVRGTPGGPQVVVVLTRAAGRPWAYLCRADRHDLSGVSRHP